MYYSDLLADENDTSTGEGWYILEVECPEIGKLTIGICDNFIRIRGHDKHGEYIKTCEHTFPERVEGDLTNYSTKTRIIMDRLSQ